LNLKEYQVHFKDVEFSLVRNKGNSSNFTISIDSPHITQIEVISFCVIDDDFPNIHLLELPDQMEDIEDHFFFLLKLSQSKSNLNQTLQKILYKPGIDYYYTIARADARAEELKVAHVNTHFVRTTGLLKTEQHLLDSACKSYVDLIFGE